MDREKFIKENLEEHYKELLSLLHPVDKHVGIFLQGSQNYNLDLYTDDYKSDIDTKAILLPSLLDICKNKEPVSTTHIRANNEHIDLKDIRSMFDTFKKQNVNFIEILFTDYKILNPVYEDIFKQINSFKDDFVRADPCQNVKTMSKMSKEKLKALTHPYPATQEKIEKYGYDGKQLSHIIRLNDFIERYIDGDDFKSCLTPSGNVRDLILDAKLNKFSLDEAKELASEFDTLTYQLKEEFTAKHEKDAINEEAFEKMEKVKIDILMRSFKEELR